MMKRSYAKKQLGVLVLTVLAMAAVFHLRIWLFENFVIGYPLGNEQDVYENIEINNLKRGFMIHLPENYKPGDRLPLVLVLHGAGSNSRLMRELTGMNKVANRENFIAVYPDGTGLFDYMFSWNAGECCNYVEPFGVNDTEFLSKVIEEMELRYGVDENRVYVTGLSNGGMMAYRLACELSDKIAAVAAVSASMWVKNCEPTDYVSVIVFHGIEDKVIPFDGGKSSDWFVKFFDLNYLAVEDAVSFWMSHNKCGSSVGHIELSNIEKRLYNFCEKDTEVVLYKVADSGHAWPGGKQAWVLGGRPNGDINASDTIWKFFNKHYKIK